MEFKNFRNTKKKHTNDTYVDGKAGRKMYSEIIKLELKSKYREDELE